MRKSKFILSLFLIISLLFNYIPVYVMALSSYSNDGEVGADFNNSMHYIITHWHDIQDTDTSIETDNGTDNETDKGSFLTVEGYIVPNINNKYDFYYMNQETKELVEITDNVTEISTDIGSIDRETGKINLNIKPMDDENGNALERFSGISISAGHNAINSDDNDNSLEISYRTNVHLVKANIFYSKINETVYGSGKDDAIFGTDETQTNLEQDTSWVYTYTKDINNCKKGDIVKDENQHPIFDNANLPTTLVEGEDVVKTKVYSTFAGLHTDKTATAIDDRTFNLDLESWYSGVPTADVGLVLDSSGSMSFTSDELTPININKLNLTDEQKEALSTKILNSEKYKDNPTNKEWDEEIFLTNEEVNSILNIHNTDDSKLSASGYTYYVFDPRSTVNEYVALGYWDGSIKDIKEKIIGYYEFNRGTSQEPSERDWLKNSATEKSAKLVNQVKNGEPISFTETENPQDWGEYSRLKMNTTNGLDIRNIDDGVGILLDAVPTSENFTISFSVKKDTSTQDNTTEQNYTDILYVGPLNNTEDTNYFRAIRDGREGGSVLKQGNSSSRFRGYNNQLTKDNKVSDVNGVFSTAGKEHNITFVFKEGKLTTYLDGNIEESSKDIPVTLSDRNIILNGFNNKYNGADIFVDNVVVIDSALNDTEVQNLKDIVSTSNGTSEYIIYNKNENEESIGTVNHNFVGLNKGLPGWYYVNYVSNWSDKYINENIQSCKMYWGISGKNDLTFKDDLTSPTTNELKNTEFTYKPEQNTPTRFYIDADGYLRCFFTSGTKQDVTGTSLVYYKDDTQYIKTEALQRAIGSFAKTLNKVSPDSQMSAVRFSTNEITDEELDKLVLLDWTNDLFEEQSIMSLNRGTGGTLQGTLSTPTLQKNQPIYQYNYGITGGTATYTGLKSFYENLYERANETSSKYLIIFTDGKDSTDETKKQDSIQIANELKENGYTIFAIMLTGGSVEKNDDATSEYQQAKDFLLKLVGTSDSIENSEEYFFSTLEGERSIDSLTEIFTENILKRITFNLEKYNVKDYIDPRFDLVSGEGNIYNLNADGNVVIKDKDGVVLEEHNIKDNPLPIKVSNNYMIDENARKANLNYDNNMYYLVWENQTIPGYTTNARQINLWKTQITIKAKDDFIGGNAILTNGNLEQMNMVYSNQDTDYSSGTNDVYIEDNDTYPSKGFPRVTVNVGSSENNFTEAKQIYMGETINNSDYANNLLENAYEKLENTNLYYYLEYLERYALANDEELSDYESKIVAGEKIKIPYYYLQNAENSNQIGNIQHKNDLIGYIEYELTPIATEDDEDDIIVQDKNARKMTLTIKYSPLEVEEVKEVEEVEEVEKVEETEQNSRKKENLKLISDTNYLWNEQYKPTEGEIIEDKNIVVDNNIEEVSGKIALKLIFKSNVQTAIGDKQLTYQIDLVRNYEGTSKKVGTFNAVYQKDNLPEPDENGDITILATITYDEENQYMTNYGLPIGTYTIENPIVDIDDVDVEFDIPSIVKDSTQYTNEVFNLDDSSINPQNYIASFGEDNTIILGDLDNTEKTYTDYRYGLLEVLPSVNSVSEPEPENPEPENPEPESPEPESPEPESPEPQKPIPSTPQQSQNNNKTDSNLPFVLPFTGKTYNYVDIISVLVIIYVTTTIIVKKFIKKRRL